MASKSQATARPAFIDGFKLLVERYRKYTKEYNAQRPKAIELLQETQYEDIYLGVTRKQEFDVQEAHTLAIEYLQNGWLTQKQYDRLYISVIDRNEFEEAIKKGLIDKEHCWAPKNKKVRPIDGVTPRRIKYVSKTYSVKTKDGDDD